jgi:ribosomal protein L7/L12
MDDAQLAQRFGAIEQQLRLISEHLGLSSPAFASDGLTAPGLGEPASPSASGLPAEVLELAQAGHTTQAISRLRQLTGASLLEAKRAIDAL